ncbi:S41 family peptidase [Sphingomonas sp. CBMAI 2297]|uniref:S41 family peptidase n=1 Tax=Sphingomonas sp. CBMAI 2297 TaxID=2991720 RepID=UPI0024540F54|nr:S41 family peptidase [Sphingomonas sp. CBMAI 2297]MDH4743840.1 S41 family peptidase [Sphingomonas sp. CBMAI 2297]
MSLLLALVLAFPVAQDAHDGSSGDLSHAFQLIKENSLVPIAEDRMASEAARFMSMIPELQPDAISPADVRDLPKLLAYFRALRTSANGKLDERRLVEAAINGMAASSGARDGYIDLDAQRELKCNCAASIGVSASLVGGMPVVVLTAPGSPSADILHEGDVITRIDGESTIGIGLDRFVARLRGEPDSIVTLTVQRPGVDPAEIRLARKVNIAKPVSWRMEGAVGIITVSSLGPDVTSQVKQAIVALRDSSRKPEGYILDLRGNGGGLLSVASDLADIFMASGPIGMQRGREPYDIERYAAKRGDDIRGLPLVVLTDRQTGSGAEIVAAALQDTHRARIVGQKTFGNGLIQSIVPLSSHAAIRITTGQYFRGSGAPIQEVGVKPDIETPAGQEKGDDKTLKAALGLLAAPAS